MDFSKHTKKYRDNSNEPSFSLLGVSSFQTCFINISDRFHTGVRLLYLDVQTFLTITLLLSGFLAS